MNILFADEFCLQAQHLRWSYDFLGLENLLQENRATQSYRQEKTIAMYEAICASFTQPPDKQVIEKFQNTLQLDYAGLPIEKYLLDAQLYVELTQVYTDLQQYDLEFKVHKKAEVAFNKAIELYEQYYSEEWWLQRWFGELYIFIQYVGARVHLRPAKSDAARDYARRALDMGKKINSTLMRPHCYIILAICFSRRRSVKNFEQELTKAKFAAEDAGIAEQLAYYFKFMDKLLLLHKDQIWDYRGKKLVEYTEDEVLKIYRKVQNAKIGNWIDPEFREKNLWGAKDRPLELV